MRRQRPLLLVVTLALLTTGCLGNLPHEPAADQLVAAVSEPLALPVRESQPHWLLRSQPGWQGAHKRSLGGSEEDGATVIVRVALFTDATAAQEAFVTLTPQQLYHIWRHRMAAEPQPIPDPPALAGDAVQMLRYAVREPSRAPAATVPVEMTVVRAGRAVLVVDSVGVPEQRREAAVAAFVGRAEKQ